MTRRPVRVLILSCPKTGNTWLRWLLRYAYDIKIADIPLEWSTAAVADLPPEWVSHQHLWPSEGLTRWLSDNDIALVTTVRHPGDALVSFFHYAKWNPEMSDMEGARLRRDGERPGRETLDYMRYAFAYAYSISLAWARLGAHVIRYEDLLADPMAELARLSARIGPLPEEQLRHAVLCCRPDRMTAPGLVDARHLRRASSGAWKSELPDEIVRQMAKMEPFATACARFGYRWDRTEPDPAPFDYGAIDPFGDSTAFDNGEPLGTYLPILYLHRVEQAERRWPTPLATAGDSFWNWLMTPAQAAGPAPVEGGPRMTQLMRLVYEMRSDLRAAYPDVHGADWLTFCQWFLGQGCIEWQLPRRLLAPVEQGLLDRCGALLSAKGTPNAAAASAPPVD